MENRTEMEIDLLGLFLHLKKRIWIILLVTVVFALGGYFSTKMMMTPQYTAKTQIYIYQGEVQENMVDYTSLAVATQLRKDCAVLITGENVTKVVVEKLNLGMSAKALSGAVKVTTEDNTRILSLSYTDTNPERAALVINTVREVAAEQIKTIMEVDAIKTIFEAEVPTTFSAANAKKNATTAAIIGAVLACGVIIVLFLLDDTIRTEDDVERHLGLCTLAGIPASSELKIVRAVRDGAKGGKPSQRRKR